MVHGSLSVLVYWHIQNLTRLLLRHLLKNEYVSTLVEKGRIWLYYYTKYIIDFLGAEKYDKTNISEVRSKVIK